MRSPPRPWASTLRDYKILAFVIGSLFAGLAGALYAHINGFLHPNTFNFIKSFDPMIIIVFGGLGSMTGTVVGRLRLGAAAGRRAAPGPARTGFETWRFVVYPLLLLIMMLLRPNGLLGEYEVPFLQPDPAAAAQDEPTDRRSATSAGRRRPANERSHATPRNNPAPADPGYPGPDQALWRAAGGHRTSTWLIREQSW